MRRTLVVRLFKILIVCLLFPISGCGGMTIKHVNPDEPNMLEGNEKVVFGRIIFTTHSGETGEASLAPTGLGLVHRDTEERAERAAILPKQWVENDGTFFWILPAGSYRIDALGWGFRRTLFRSDPDPKELRKDQVASLSPEDQPECGFVVDPNLSLEVSGDSGAIYVGSLLIDMDIEKKEHGIEVKKINSIEIRDEYAETLELFKKRCPSFALTVDKRLMTGASDRPASVANGHCPSGTESFFREFTEHFIGYFMGGIIGGGISVGTAY